MSGSHESKGPQGGGELSGLLRQAEAMQRDVDRALGELKNEIIESADAAQLVQLKLGADGTVREFRILLAGLRDDHRRALEEAVTVALRGAVERMFAARQKKAAAVTKGLALPGLFT
jgi:hypothetical protein